MDTDLNKKLCENMQKILPHLEAQKAEVVAEFLRSKGVKKENDLRRITVDMLCDILDFVDSSDLVEAWQNAYGISQANRASEGSSGTVVHATAGPSSSRSSIATARPSSSHRSISTARPMPVFDVDSPYMPSKVKEAIKAMKRPPCSAREDMVGRIVDRCREVVPNLDRQSFNDVARELVNLYPHSFKDTLPVSKHGSDSLAQQLKIKFDNDRRPVTSRVGKENTAPSIKEAYGCELWNPALPDGHTQESQEKLMNELIAMSRLQKSKIDMRALRTKLMDSYYLQRQQINGKLVEASKPNKKRTHKEANKDNGTEPQPRAQGLQIPALRENWPFLFTPSGINIHFKLLTNVDFRDSLSTFIREEATDIMDFLATKNDVLARINRRALRIQDQQGQSSSFVKLTAVLEMLITFFGEKMDSFIRFTERTITFDELKGFANLPEDKTPFLVAAGESLYDFDKLFVFIDNTVVASVKNIEEGFAFMFCSYFIFNIIFSSDLATLLTYTQRVIATINPDGKGSKSRNPTITRKVNEKVVRFVNRMQEYKQQMEEERSNDP